MDSDTAAGVKREARFSLRAKLTLLAVGLASVPLVGVGVALIDVNEDAVMHLSREVQLAVLEDTAQKIALELGAAEDALEMVGRLLGDDDVPEAASLAGAIAVVEGASALDHVGVYDAQGVLIDVIRERAASAVQVPEHLAADVIERADEHGRSLGETTAAELAPRVLLVVPIRSRLVGAPTGFAASNVSLERLARHVEDVARERFPELRDSLIVVDAAGLVLAAPRGSAQAPMTRATAPGLNGIEPASFGTPLAQQGLVGEGDDRVVASVRTLPAYRWAVAVQVPYAVAFASLERMRWIVIATVALVLLLAVLLAFFFARRITSPLDKLVTLAEELGARSFGRRVQIETSDELATLGRVLSDASVQLGESEAKLRREQEIRSDLRRYLPAELVDRVVRREQSMALGGERREITVLFADVVGFTPLSEEREPEQVVAILNELFTILTEIVYRHGGMVDKFIGDCVMAIWGAPESQEDHTQRAMAAAEEMLRWLEAGNLSWQERYGVSIQLAIGVHRGEAVVGNIGSETRMAYTAIGDVVNVAARLEGIARPMQILVTDEVRREIADDFDCLDAGQQELAGRRTTVQLYEVRS